MIVDVSRRFMLLKLLEKYSRIAHLRNCKHTSTYHIVYLFTVLPWKRICVLSLLWLQKFFLSPHWNSLLNQLMRFYTGIMVSDCNNRMPSLPMAFNIIKRYKKRIIIFPLNTSKITCYADWFTTACQKI